MFDLESQLEALVENYGLALLLEQNDISEYSIIKYLVTEGFINLDDYFNLDAERKEWKRVEE